MEGLVLIEDIKEGGVGKTIEVYDGYLITLSLVKRSGLEYLDILKE